MFSNKCALINYTSCSLESPAEAAGESKIVDLPSPSQSTPPHSPLVSLVEINCSFYIRKQPHSWSAVTHWLISLSHRTHNHCDQLSSCSQMTTFIWYGLVMEGHSHFRMLGMWQFFIFFLFSLSCSAFLLEIIEFFLYNLHSVVHLHYLH